MLTIDIAATDSRAAVNEDVVGHDRDAAWVIDGATGVGPALMDAPSDAAWLARTADAALRRVLAEKPDLPTRDVVRRTILACRDALAEQAVRPASGPHEHPSAAFAMVRRIGARIELCGLADCRILYRGDDGGVRVFSDRSLDAVEATTLAALRALLDTEPDLAPAALLARLMPRLAANRARMNRGGGYWVLGTDPAAADRLALRTLPARPGQRFAIASDGFLRLVELFGAATPAAVLDIRDPADWQTWLARLRALETEPGAYRRYPRCKLHDDASLVALTVAAGSAC